MGLGASNLCWSHARQSIITLSPSLVFVLFHCPGCPGVYCWVGSCWERGHSLWGVDCAVRTLFPESTGRSVCVWGSFLLYSFQLGGSSLGTLCVWDRVVSSRHRPALKGILAASRSLGFLTPPVLPKYCQKLLWGQHKLLHGLSQSIGVAG